jgi:hypothetical protein
MGKLHPLEALSLSIGHLLPFFEAKNDKRKNSSALELNLSAQSADIFL